MGNGLKGLNFKKETFRDKLPEWMTQEIGTKSEKKLKNKKKFNLNIKINMNLGEKMTTGEKGLLRVAVTILLLICIYSGISLFLGSAIKNKNTEIEQATKDVNTQIASINSDTSKIRENTTKYKEMTQRLDELTTKTQEKNKRKNAIPTLLNQIMYIIPKGVQITSIENTSGSDIIINAQSYTYEQLGYLKSKIKEDGILLNVVSDSGQKEGQTGLIKTVIEGKLPIE